ncbi:dUTP diphosphatase, partial [Candidatus Woesearchaeota archaeon]|nr:dUTP diphosphatase [Candidatus Woesearchaeota archaeon]
LWNYTDSPVTLSKGDRVVQMIVMTREQVSFEEKDKFSTEDRGGFGSTGK